VVLAYFTSISDRKNPPLKKSDKNRETKSKQFRLIYIALKIYSKMAFFQINAQPRVMHYPSPLETKGCPPYGKKFFVTVLSNNGENVQ
jgi:hypothetical protein